MKPTRQIQKLEVGMLDGKAGFTMTDTDGQKEHFLFSVGIAEELANGLLGVCHQLRYVERQLGVPGDAIGVRDVSNVRLSPPNEGDAHA